MKFYTYFHTRNDSGAVFNIGKGKGTRLDDKSCRNQHWQNIVAKHGHSSHIAARWPTEAEAFEHEKFLIACFKGLGAPLCNQTDGGDGVPMTAEIRSKLQDASAIRWQKDGARAAHGAKTKGRVQPEDEREKRRISSTGRKHTVEAKEKMRLIQRGRTVSQECRQKLRDANLGKVQSEESNQKRSTSLKGRVFSDEHRAKLSAAMLGNKSRVGQVTSNETKEKQRQAAKRNLPVLYRL